MGEKTTIEIDNIRELKQHALDTNKTLKQLINEAILEKIQRERLLIQKTGGVSEVSETGEDKNGVMNGQNKIAQIKKILLNSGSLAVVEKECSRHNILLDDLSSNTITPELLRDIKMAITLVFDDETADQIIDEIENLLN